MKNITNIENRTEEAGKKIPKSIAYAPELSALDIKKTIQYLDQLCDKYKDAQSTDFLKKAPLLAQELPYSLREYIHNVRTSENPTVFVIPSLNIIGETQNVTPKDWRDATLPSPNLKSEIYLALVASLLGDIFGWTTQQNGKFIHDVMPMKGQEYEQVGWSSLTQLSWHTEDAFHPYRADYLALLCLRNNESVPTTLFCVSDLKIPGDIEEILWENRFIIVPDQSHTLKNNSAESKIFSNIEAMIKSPTPVSLLFGTKEKPYLRIDPDYMMAVPGDKKAEEALKYVIQYIDNHLYDLALRPGDLCIIDNLQAVHGRKSFQAKFDGYDRWIKRMNVRRDLRPASNSFNDKTRLMDTLPSKIEKPNIPAKEDDLIEAVQPIRGMALATTVQHFFSRGIYDELNHSNGHYTIRELANKLDFDEERLLGLLRFLRNEGFLDGLDQKIYLTEKSHRWSTYRAWFEMMVGGYAQSFAAMGDALAKGSQPAPRDGRLVGKGSCGISMHDSIPIVKRLMSLIPEKPKLVIDLGCGSASYLTEICKMDNSIKAIGIEPDKGGCFAAEEHISECGMVEQISIVNADAIEYIKSMKTKPDLILICFVIHEVLGQSGEEKVIEMVKAAMSGGPEQRLIIIDIDYKIDDPNAMKHKLAEGYYNAYFLLHPFTSQRLERQEYWDKLFERCGLEIESKQTTDQFLDSTNIELGWLLRKSK
ncbi:guanitoxin biosynthesis L-enduracididine beta-hydroxylase GntD [Leptospira santarosai]|uniref:guanitoxin biosynthesis L-enduracididine beta-hydroxylase GntD n=1 Tax=Leptospira santarosai TaxID=28183 RepID=UPI000297A735|nr:guanitoxin biosynthesis L-enduracididine beta-hydroxylase GntD [Leptospira santarosai]EKS07945.1 putative arginine beta-hydroxylase, Fe(II)/alpha-ketoglutarate-dependent [Leptospira santarosai str. JET]